jgi:transposase
MHTSLIDEPTWEKIEPLLPAEHRHRRASNREVLEAIVYVLSQDLSWLALKNEEWGVHGANVWRRLRTWQNEGVWEKVAPILVNEVPGLDAQTREHIMNGRRGSRAAYHRRNHVTDQVGVSQIVS